MTFPDLLLTDELGRTSRGSSPGPHLLVVDEGGREPVTGADAVAQLLRHLPGVDVALLCAGELGLDTASCPSASPLLSKYHLILVTTESLRQRLCEAMPGLSDRVYRLDHFIAPPACDPPRHAPPAGGPIDGHALADGVSHWSTCISQWLDTPLCGLPR